MLKSLLGCVGAVACLSLLAPGAACAAQTFAFSNVVQLAQKQAKKPYTASPTVPSFLLQLGYDEYRKIRFRPSMSLWHQSHAKFQVMLIAPGENYRHTVQINMVDASGVHAVGFHKSWFTWPSSIAAKVPGDLGYAGFKLTFPLNPPDLHNQFLVFAGASYFRGVARGERFGLSARGIAINTGLAAGEEFPGFTRYWMVRPRPGATSMKFYALLDGPSLSGAYEFVIYPGAPLRIKVHARLFVRKNIGLLGFAPLTSMFYYGSNTPRPAGKWRPAVHDSGGLLIHSGTGEWLWRPLINPASLQNDYFTANSPKGFGLLQRATAFRDYEDSEARYDKRPSAWVKPQGDWGKGHVVLVQIPTNSEINDNIVAFWSPDKKATSGATYNLRYTLLFGKADIPPEPMAHAAMTLVGRGESGKPNAYRIVVDFSGGPLAALKSDAKVDAVITGLARSHVLEQSVHAIKSPQMWRLSMLVQPADGKPLKLRAYLKDGAQTLSETWSYELPAKNRFTGND